MNIKNIKVGSLITVAVLEELDACPQHIVIFKKEWPNGMRIRKKNLLRAVQLELGIDWFADEVFKGREHSRYWKLYMEDRTGTARGDAALSFWETICKRGGK